MAGKKGGGLGFGGKVIIAVIAIGTIDFMFFGGKLFDITGIQEWLNSLLSAR